VPAQECQFSVLCSGTIGPVGGLAVGWAVPAADPDGLEVVLLAEQALIPASAAVVSAAAKTRPVRYLRDLRALRTCRPGRRPEARRDMDMPTIMPDTI